MWISTLARQGQAVAQAGRLPVSFFLPSSIQLATALVRQP